MKIDSRLLSGLFSAILGIMFIVLKGGVIGIALTVIGLLAIAMAVTDFVNNKTSLGVIKSIIGVSVIVVGWVLVDIALYIISGVLIVLGIYQIISAIKISELCGPSQRTLLLIRPIVTFAAGICLFFNKNGVIDWLFIIVGALILAQGVLSVLEVVEKK